MATRQKKTVFTGVSQEMANDAFASYAKSDARIQKLQAEIELQCAKIREKHADELSRLDAEREQAFDVLQSYALENQQELFAKKKSLEMAHGTIGFRTGTPKLKTLKGFTWGAALNLTKHILPQYIRVSEEIAKDMLIADRESEDVQTGTHNSGIPMRDALAECGMQVVQEETFYVEPKKEE
ncbi:MAG: host-nuclease inhibitor Gam family protein [Paludibacteraceae bacterium]|nr:host-nuclease inhibitor Gam family protein [Paludibacteraceae bacterium]